MSRIGRFSLNKPNTFVVYFKPLLNITIGFMIGPVVSNFISLGGKSLCIINGS